MNANFSCNGGETEITSLGCVFYRFSKKYPREATNYDEEYILTCKRYNGDVTWVSECLPHVYKALCSIASPT